MSRTSDSAHLQYFPTGETWVEESSNTQRTPYLFSGKELDEETGLYDFGARYYDPRTALWLSTDPALAEYLPKADLNRDLPIGSGREHELPGLGGIYRPVNLNLYAHAQHNPVTLKDPDGRAAWCAAGLAVPGVGTLAAGGCWVVTGAVASGVAYFGTKAAVQTSQALQNRQWSGVVLNEAGEEAGDPSNIGNGQKTVDDLIEESAKGRETKGRSDQYIHEGGREQRDKDFDSLGVTNVKDRGNGTKTGTLPDGRPVNVHDSKTDGVPTIQIGNGSREIKIRYPD